VSEFANRDVETIACMSRKWHRELWWRQHRKLISEKNSFL